MDSGRLFLCKTEPGMTRDKQADADEQADTAKTGAEEKAELDKGNCPDCPADYLFHRSALYRQIQSQSALR